MRITHLIDIAIEAAIQAGHQIMEVYKTTDFDVQLKEDRSPLTKADLISHAVIRKILEQTRLPVLSEEDEPIDYSKRKNWDEFWLVDPLDGTKEFIKRNGDFTVNIALIIKYQAIAGVIFTPVSGELFVGITGIGAWKKVHPEVGCTFAEMQTSGTKLPVITNKTENVIAVSRSHINSETEAFIADFQTKKGIIKLLRRGSSLKIAMVAEGIADVYPRFGTTMEWDTAAGHALVKAVGKNIYHTDLQSELHYNKENLKNPHFIVL